MSESIWAFKDNLDWRQPIGKESPFYVPLENHRGDYSRRKVLGAFNLDQRGGLRPGTALRQSTTVLFGGHIGSGKSTELRLLQQCLQHSYTTIFMELTQELDINNLRFSDVLIAQAHHMVDLLQEKKLLSASDERVLVKPVLEWFESCVLSKSQFTSLTGEVKAQAQAGGGLPGLLRLLAKVTASIRSGATYREELRNEIRNNFTSLLNAFNALLAHANRCLQQQQQGPMLFIIDGSDKLSREDSRAFFRDDVNQLGQIDSNTIICAPINVLLEESVTAQRYEARERLPMVKISERDETPCRDAVAALVELIDKRIPERFFDSPETMVFLARMSGGHPRDLLRLVKQCFDFIDDAPITREHAERAAKNVGVDYQRLVNQKDWRELARIDASKGNDTDITEDRRRLLYDLVLLEYNNYWWRSHPLVQQRESYKRARQEIDTAAPDQIRQ